MESHLRRLLDLVIPFRFLPAEEKAVLTLEFVPLKVAPFETIFSQGSEGKEIYLLEEGQIELVYEENNYVKPANVVRPGHYFGERAALLDQERTSTARAVTSVLCWSLPGERLLDLIGRFNLFAQAFGTILRDKHGIFLPLEHFSAEVASSLAQGFFRMEKLISLYRELEPAMHPFMDHHDKIDVAALSYAVKRLPENVTSTFAWFFTDDIPVLYTDPTRIFLEIPTAARRRNVWQMLPGKNMVLLRNGMSDILDFLTCLCLFAIESQKIRRRLHDPGLLQKLLICNNAAIHDGFCADQDETLALLEELPFTQAEAQDLYKIWGRQVLNRLYELTIHHEDWALAAERQLNNYNSRRSEKWANLVSHAVHELMGYEPWDLPDHLEVHIISSNTHSVTNCLSPYARRHEKAILEWARTKKHPFLQRTWSNEQDLLYALLPDYFLEDSSRMPTLENEAEWGIRRISDQATTGIAVQLIDTAKLLGEIDRDLPKMNGRTSRLIVNIDYAFGVQAEEIIRNLITLFHKHIKSVNVLGKAGSLIGKRGDVLIPTAFILQSDDSFLPFPNAVDIGRLSTRIPQSSVHVGPLLTVEGTLLQNRSLLNFYKNIWKCLGLEMEGVYYARQVIESVQLGVVDPNLVQRYYYYVSDLPLAHGEQLSLPLAPIDGIPPLYAITREILSSILG